jgi:hypothetical protein
MPKTRTTVTLDAEVFRAVKIKAARTGKRDSQVIEESLRRDLGLEGLEDLWTRVTATSEGAGMALADAELHSMRKEKRAPGRP